MCGPQAGRNGSGAACRPLPAHGSARPSSGPDGNRWRNPTCRSRDSLPRPHVRAKRSAVPRPRCCVDPRTRRDWPRAPEKRRSGRNCWRRRRSRRPKRRAGRALPPPPRRAQARSRRRPPSAARACGTAARHGAAPAVPRGSAACARSRRPRPQSLPRARGRGRPGPDWSECPCATSHWRAIAADRPGAVKSRVGMAEHAERGRCLSRLR